MDGFIRLNRKFFTNVYWSQQRTFSLSEAWLDLIQMARFDAEPATKELPNGRLITIKRGEIHAGLRFLSDRWGWSVEKTQRYINKHIKKHEIERRTEHGESIIYGLIGLVMVVTITAVISRGIVNIVPDYKKELSRNNSYQIEKNEYKYPTIIADEVIYADYGDTTFNYMDYIRSRDYRGGNITDKVKVYGKVDVNQKGVYRLRCTVISYFNLACTKYINIIVE